MVHYDNPWAMAPVPPPICPKCGSHRTQIVGMSNDGSTVIVRCNFCGERSEIALPSDDEASAPAAGPLDDVFAAGERRA